MVSTAILCFCWKALAHFLVFAILVKEAGAVPNHGSQRFLGHSYWNTRYPSLGYSEWNGFWNNFYSRRVWYNRSETSKQYCTRCKCDTMEIQCPKNLAGELKVQNKVIKIIRNGQLSKSLTKVKFFGTQLRYIEEEAFHNLTQMEDLNLANNDLHEFPDLSTNTALKELDLLSNRIRLWRHNYTILPRSLEKIILIDNQIDWIPEKWFDLPNLKYIALSMNKLKALPGTAFVNCKSMQYLNLSNNHISRISPEALQHLSHLKILELHDNAMEYIGAKVFYKIPQLLHLDLVGNKLETIAAEGYSPAFQDLPKLKCLVLMAQDPKTRHVMYNSFVGLPSLEDLHVENNQIESLTSYGKGDFPPELENLHGFVHSNKIRAIDEEDLWLLDKLQEMHLDGNAFYYVPSALQRKSRIPAVTSLDLQGNVITYILKETFSELDKLKSLYMQSNKIVTIENGAFNENIQHMDLGKNKIGRILKILFRDIAGVTYLNLDYNEIAYIEDGTFEKFKKFDRLKLQHNQLTYLPTGGDFSNMEINDVRFHDNEIVSIQSGAFKKFNGPTCTLDLRFMKLEKIASETFKDVTVKNDMKLENNFLNAITVKMFGDSASFIQGELNLAYNKIRGLHDESLKGVKVTQKIYLQSNSITTLNANVFSKLGNLRALYLHENAIQFVPTFPELKFLRFLWLADNQIENLGKECFNNLPNLEKLYLGGRNQLACDCNVYSSIVHVINSVVSNWPPVCRTPSQVQQVTFFPGGTYANVYPQRFLCNPVNVSASALGDYQLLVTWDRPQELHVFINVTENATRISTWDAVKVKSVIYTVTCLSKDAATLSNTSSNESLLFTQKDGVQAGTDYTCHVTMTVTAHNGTYLDGGSLGSIWTRTTPKSEKASVTTIEGKAPLVNTTANKTNYFLDSTFYDFRAADGDFVGVPSTYKELYHNPKHIASPYGSWLAVSSTPTASSFSDWFRSESQRNLHYEGKLELKKQLETDKNGNSVFRLYNEKFFPVDGRGFGAEGQRDGYTNALRNYGFTTAIRTSFNFSGQENIAVAGGEELWVFIAGHLVLEVFHDPLNKTIPCATVNLDPVLKGPYRVEILTGNEQRRFEIKDEGYSSPSPPSTVSPPSFLLNGETIYLCPNATANATVRPISTSTPGIESFTMSSPSAKLILKSPLDYEHTTSYTLTLRITDTGKVNQPSGNITIKIFILDYNDHCPVLPDVEYALTPIPPLQKAPFFVAVATDGDSGFNAKITFKSQVFQKINKTAEWSYHYYIFAVDGGTPKRGDRIPLAITFNATCQETGEIVVNETSGEVFFRAPGMTGSEYPRNSTVKPKCQRCSTGYYCVGDGTEKKCGVTSPTEFSFGGAPNCSACPRGWELFAEREDSMNALWGPTVMAPVIRVRYVHQEVTTMQQKQKPATAAGPCMKGPCFPSVDCVNIGNGLFECGPCPEGFQGDGKSCIDINECVLAKPCYESSQCVNLSPGYRCGGCPNGYRGNAPSGVGLEHAQKYKQTCEEIDECSDGIDTCDPNSNCINTPGSFKCSPCNPGFIGDGYFGCYPGDLCTNGSHTCQENAQCISRGPGKYKCTCRDGFAGDGEECEQDPDLDAIPVKGLSCTLHVCRKDNCIFVKNLDQEDTDKDGVGNACDNCVNVHNTLQIDTDGDGQGDECDNDKDGDGILNTVDKCAKLNATGDQVDDDGDGIGNLCDNCPKNSNRLQVRLSSLPIEIGGDGDGVLDEFDNCPDLPNGEQADADGDNKGDACDEDQDNDGIANILDNCRLISNSRQEHQKLAYDVEVNPVGDACVNDFDADGVPDDDDMCPHVTHISKTSFLNYFTVDLYPGHGEPSPEWRVAKMGVDVEHLSNTNRPGMLIGATRYGPVDYSGTIYVKDSQGSDYLGVVFGYQSNLKFYVVMWRRENINYGKADYNAGIKGLQLKVVNSATGPGSSLAKALWHAGDTQNQVTLLWDDPSMKGWRHQTPYGFHITHRPSIGLIRVRIKQGEKVLTDSGNIYNTLLTGGRLGMIVYGQHDVIWSRLEARCFDRVNQALMFDGLDDHVTLASIHDLALTGSFTISVWVQMAADYPLTVMPIVCSDDETLCLYLNNRRIHGNLGKSTVIGSQVIEPEKWHHVVFRFDAQRHEIEVFVNGLSVGKKVDTAPYVWSSTVKLVVGRDKMHFLNGTIDDLTLWGVRVPGSEIVDYMKLAGLTWPIHKGLVRAHFNMEDTSGSVILDQAGNGFHGSLVGSPVFVPSNIDKNRFVLSYPKNRRKRSQRNPVMSAWAGRHSEL
ncbi:Cartilage oligomeric matrix protein [Acropora cervicornis]|uniref:Cartilage oligomeric matrix protein n=1 Tax=Acropora cervicornis TaxID=6130 RepID=A0AAD9VA23_ACRCE|nr:Cartilage oligomeric matrix protein [Acropora cervicornis]